MAIVLEKCITEALLSVVLFCGQKDSIQKDIHKEIFLLFTVGSVCREKRFTAGWQTFR
jgi:hypothetical protein